MLTMIDLRYDNNGLFVSVHANLRTPNISVYGIPEFGNDHFTSLNVYQGDESLCLFLSPEQARNIAMQLLAKTSPPPAEGHDEGFGIGVPDMESRIARTF